MSTAVMAQNGSPVTETPRNVTTSGEPAQITPPGSEGSALNSQSPATDTSKIAKGSKTSSKRDSPVRDAAALKKKATASKKRKTESSDESSPPKKKRAPAPRTKAAGAARPRATANGKGKGRKVAASTPLPVEEPKPEAHAELTPRLWSKVQRLTHFIENFDHNTSRLTRAEGQPTQYKIAEIHLNLILHGMALDFGLDPVNVNLALLQDTIIDFFDAPLPGNPVEFRWLTLDASVATDFEKMCLEKVKGWGLDHGVSLLEVECEIFWRDNVVTYLEAAGSEPPRDVPVPGWRAWPHVMVEGAADQERAEPAVAEDVHGDDAQESESLQASKETSGGAPLDTETGQTSGEAAGALEEVKEAAEKN